MQRKNPFASAARAIAGLAMSVAGTAKADLIFSGTGTDSDGSPISRLTVGQLLGVPQFTSIFVSQPEKYRR